MKKQRVIIGIAAKNMLFKILIWILLTITFFVVTLDTVSADDLVEGDYTYTVINREVTITKYTGTSGLITIPSTLGGYPTVAIGDSAFYRCSTLTSVTIPNNITTIGQGAFYYASLSAIIIGNSVTTIGDKAFFHCTNLTSITFLGLVAPISVGDSWITGTSVEIRGHAYADSDFTASGGMWNGLMMGTVISDENELPAYGNERPVADFTWTPSTPIINQEITFNASTSKDPGGFLNSYEWDWDNDSSYEESHHIPTATNSWAQAGNYPVTLRVSDNNGSTNTKTIIIPISDSSENNNADNKGTPGFELVFVLFAILVAMFLRRRK